MLKRTSQFRFNPTRVRLERSSSSRAHRRVRRFNPTRVRLELDATTGERLPEVLQPHEGPSGTHVVRFDRQAADRASTPRGSVWNPMLPVASYCCAGFNPTRVRLEPSRQSSIGCGRKSFNPTRVRLEPPGVAVSD